MPSIGELSGVGVYECEHCGGMVTLNEKDEEMPQCPVCNTNKYVRRDDLVEEKDKPSMAGYQ